MREILALAWAEVLHVVRDKATLAQVIMVPVVQLLVLSNAATFTIRETPAYVVDLDHTPTSRGLLTRFTASGHFRITGASGSTDLGNDALLRDEASLVVVIPRDFEKSLVREGAAQVLLSVNAEKGSAAGIIQSYASDIMADYARELGAELRPGIATVVAPDRAAPLMGVARIEGRVRSWYNPTLNYKHYMVPGILVALVTLISTLLSAQNIAREKEIGTLEQLNVTPITKGQFIMAKLLPFWVLAMIDLGIGLLIAWSVFGVPMRGSLLLLFAVAGIYLVVTLGIGLLISGRVETQQQAMFVTFFVMMIYLLMSGLFTPVDSMPHWVQVAAEFNPVKHFVSISRAILIKGAGLAEVVRPVAILVAFAVGTFWLAVGQYTKRTA
ncbi:MAG TPA: ABC transporter permease [Gemmatimonadales bacterium]|jgi:ABC-2 type transport system permease protein|nr:ABC transporter permease [Gemmatimonadales bacterium]